MPLVSLNGGNGAVCAGSEIPGKSIVKMRESFPVRSDLILSV